MKPAVELCAGTKRGPADTAWCAPRKYAPTTSASANATAIPIEVSETVRVIEVLCMPLFPTSAAPQLGTDLSLLRRGRRSPSRVYGGLARVISGFRTSLKMAQRRGLCGLPATMPTNKRGRLSCSVLGFLQHLSQQSTCVRILGAALLIRFRRIRLPTYRPQSSSHYGGWPALAPPNNMGAPF